MSQNRLGVASAILIALLGLTVWQLNARKAADHPVIKAEVKLPKIERDKIDELDIAAAERPKVHMVKKGDKWRLTEPVDAEADADAVSSALGKLAELEVTGVAATVAKNYERLEVDATKGTHVIAKSGGKTVIDGWVGSYQAGNSMFRLEGQTAVATVRGSIRYAFSKYVKEWRNRQINETPTTSVQQMVFNNAHGHLEFAREGEEWKQVLGKGEKPITPLDGPKVKGIVGTASSLSAVDFAEPSVTAEQAGLGANAATLTLLLNGEGGPQQIVYRIGSQKDQSYYVQKEGVPTIYLVSQWIGGRLSSGADDLIKKEMPEASGDPHAGMPGMPPGMQGMPGMPPMGSPGNPITVQPSAVHTVTKPGAVPAKPTAAKPAAGAKPAAAKPAAAKPAAAKPAAAKPAAK